MPFRYSVDKTNRLVISTGMGHLTWQEIEARQNEARTDPSFCPDYAQLVDLRQVTGIEMPGNQARYLAQRKVFSSQSKRAFVVANPLMFGMGRMWQIYTELSEAPSQLCVFEDIQSALKWLGLQDLAL
jgi:hypothetical protein